MKLIIDIPLDLYERCKSGDYDLFDDTARAEAIKNGIPYNPSVDLDKEIELYKSKVAFYESQNTRGEYDVTARELNFVVETLEKLRSERPKGEPIIKCQDCKYRVKVWREDKRMKEKGYWDYGCKHMGDIMGFWGFGGYDDEFCSDAEQKGGENRHD